MNKKKRDIFKKGSTTYYYSSLFFPKKVKDDVFTLYAFVRTADDYVDATPQKKKEFIQFRKDTEKAFHEDSYPTNNVINDFKKLCDKKDIPYKWIESFLDAMEADLYIDTYPTYNELQKYMYGSAEVIGLCMAKILNLPKKSYGFAKKQGQAMQLINFIRDIQEDIDLGRQYLPTKDLKKFNIDSIKDLHKDNKKLILFVKFQINRYNKIQKEATIGYKYIPKKYRIMIKTASDIYKWTAGKILQDPKRIFTEKVKPSKEFVLTTLIKNYFIA